MNDHDRALKVLEALEAKPGVFYELLWAVQGTKLAGPWEIEGIGVVRRQPDGEMAAHAWGTEDGPETTYQWETGRRTPGLASEIRISLDKAMASADAELQARGWLLAPGMPTLEEMLGVGTVKGATGGVWHDGEDHSERSLAGSMGKLVASVIEEPDDVWKWRVFLPWDDKTWADDQDYATRDEAKQAADEALRGHGVVLPDKVLSAWKTDPLARCATWYRKGGPINDRIGVVIQEAGSGKRYFGHVGGNDPDGTADMHDSPSAAQAAVDEELVKRGYILTP